MSDDKIKHLEFIQNTITRMNTNSFQIKSMSITLIAAFLAIYASTSNRLFSFLAINPVLLFWFLDSYYVQMERKFRGIYENVAGIKNDIEIKVFEMPIQKFIKGKYNYWKSFFSITLFWFYGVSILILFLIFIFDFCW